MKTIDIQLGGQTYTVEERKARHNAAWRQKLSEPFGELAGLLEEAGELELTPANIAQLLRTVGDALLHSIDTVRDLLFDFSPTLSADRKRIVAEAYTPRSRGFHGGIEACLPFWFPDREVASVLDSGSATRPTSPSARAEWGLWDDD